MPTEQQCLITFYIYEWLTVISEGKIFQVHEAFAIVIIISISMSLFFLDRCTKQKQNQNSIIELLFNQIFRYRSGRCWDAFWQKYTKCPKYLNRQKSNLWGLHLTENVIKFCFFNKSNIKNCQRHFNFWTFQLFGSILEEFYLRRFCHVKLFSNNDHRRTGELENLSY